MKKAASNAKRYPLCENCGFPLVRNPSVSCLLWLCPNPRRTHKLCSGTQDKSCGYAILQIAIKKKGTQKPQMDSASHMICMMLFGLVLLQYLLVH